MTRDSRYEEIKQAADLLERAYPQLCGILRRMAADREEPVPPEELQSVLNEFFQVIDEIRRESERCAELWPRFDREQERISIPPELRSRDARAWLAATRS